MNALRKTRIKTMMKYTWPFYVISVIVVGMLLSFIFSVTHQIPEYRQLTIFISGEVVDSNKLKNDLIEKYQDNELKKVTYIDAKPDNPNYNTKLTIAGYNTADILIIPISKLESIDVASFGLELNDELIANYYQGYNFFLEDSAKYGVKVDKEKVKQYISLPNEDCYMILSGKSENVGEYAKAKNKEWNNALNVVKDWGM